ncbi:hypothetical protein ACGC1H_002026 [Rhizoctonia solani]
MASKIRAAVARPQKRGLDGKASLEPAQPRPSLIVHEGHTKGVGSVAYSPDGNSVASGSWKTIRTWDAHSLSPIGEPLTGHHGVITSVSYSPLGSMIASASLDQTIRVWEVNPRRRLGAMKGGSTVYSVAFSPDAKLIASGCGSMNIPPLSLSYSVQLWNVRRGITASYPLNGHTAKVRSVQFSPDGNRVVSGSSDKTIRVWDIERGTTIVGPLEGHTDLVLSVAFSPNGSQIVSCSKDGTVRLWDARDGRFIDVPYTGHTGQVSSVAFSPCGTYVASGGDDKTVRLWDVRTGRQVDQPFEEHTDSVQSVAFSPCGQYIASGSRDKKMIIRRVLANSLELSSDSDLRTAPEDERDFLQSKTTQIISHMSTLQIFEPSNNLISSVEPEDEASLLLNETTQIDSHMSTHEIFECLIGAGCIDLSPQMDTRQDTAMIMSGGGFGDIWVGQLHDHTKVAIKAWRTDALEQLRYKTLKRAARELFYWSRMNHRNIHKLMGVIVFKDQYLGMVSEWMENGHLHNYLQKHPDAGRYQLCIDVASGLEYMHSQSTVHGDLKAMNVLVSSDGVAMLSDFDFSVMSEASSLLFTESSNSRSGSIRWVAPEMLIEETPKRTKESDVYALGMVGIEIYTGEVPYSQCRMDFTVMTMVTRGTLPIRPTEWLKDDERGNLVRDLLLRCWSRDVSERPSAGQVVETFLNAARPTFPSVSTTSFFPMVWPALRQSSLHLP